MIPRGLLFLLACVCLLTPSSADGQWLEKTIYLPDSMAIVKPNNLAFNPLQNELYVGADGWVLVLDAATMVKTHRIPVARTRSMLYLREYNRLFVTGRGEPQDAGLYVIDCATHEVITRIPVGTGPEGMCYDSVSGKLYVSVKSADSVCVIDVPTLFQLGMIPVGNNPYRLELNRTNRKVYCGNRRSQDITIIDVDGDTVITTIGDIYHPRRLCWNPVVNKVYVAAYYDNNVVVIDGASDSVVARIRCLDNPTEIRVSPDGEKVYCTCRSGGTVYVIDPRADTVLARVELGLGAYAIAFAPRLNRVFISTDATDELYVLDGTTDSVIGVVDVGGTARFLQVSPDESTVYCLGYSHRLLSVVDAENVKLDTVLWLGFVPHALEENLDAGKVYVATLSTFGAVAVLDRTTLEIRRLVPVGAKPIGMVYNPTQAKLYVGSTRRGLSGYDTVVTVIDGWTDEVVSRVSVGRRPKYLCYNSNRDRVYVGCVEDGAVDVIDCVTDSVMARIPVGGGPHGIAYCTQEDKVYVACGRVNRVYVIDCATNTIVGIVPSPDVDYVEYNPNVNSIYAYTGLDGVPARVIECRTDEVIAVLRTYRGVDDVCVNGTGERAYFVTANGGYQVFDAYTNELLDSLFPGGLLERVGYDAATDRIYITSMDSTCVHVCDGTTGSLVTRVRMPGPARNVLCSAASRRAFVACRSNSSVVVIGMDEPGVAERKPGRDMPIRPRPTVIRAVLHMPETEMTNAQYPMTLLDIAGRCVMELAPGDNDVRHLSPGVYFVREASGVERQASSVRKVILAR